MSVVINGDTGISGVNGSAANPAIKGGDADTGIHFGTDTAAITTGGTERVSVDSSGAATFSGTVKTSKVENANTSNGGVEIDTDGHVQLDGQQLPTTGPLSHRNLFQNGAVQINQRGTTENANTYGGPDRFFSLISAAPDYLAERSQQLDAPESTGLQYCYQLKTTQARTGTTGNQYVGVGEFIEFQDVYNALWGTNTHLTVSFWVKSSITGTQTFNLNPCNTNSGLPTNRLLYHTTYTIDSANTWEYKEIVVPLAHLSSFAPLSTSGAAQRGRGLEVTWMLGVTDAGSRDNATLGWNATEYRNAVSSFGSDTGGFLHTVGATFRLTGIQVEAGAKATPFEHRTYQEMFQLCRRYFQRYEGGRIGHGIINNDTSGDRAVILQNLHTPMRSAPTIENVTNGRIVLEGSQWYDVTSIPTIAGETTDYMAIYNIVTSSQITGATSDGQVPTAWGNGASVSLSADL